MSRGWPFPPGTKCSRCRGVLPSDRKHRYCVDCYRSYSRDKKLAHRLQRDRVTGNKRFQKFGIYPGTYDRMVEAQEGLCAICRRPERWTRSGLVRTLAVDHDHVTGQIRGLLCSACNTALGYFEDSTERLEAAVRYLKEARDKAA